LVSAQVSGGGGSEIITLTGVDLSTLPFTADQIKLAVNELAIQIRMEDITADSHPTFTEQDIFQQLAAFSGGLMIPRQ